jgi:hypothetical protein
MDGGPGVVAEVVFRSRAECGRWYPPRPPWGSPHAYLALACVEGTRCPVLVRFVDGPRVSPGEPGRFVLTPQPPSGEGTPLQPGVRFSLLEPRFDAPVGAGRVLERVGRAPVPPEDAGREGAGLSGTWYGPPSRLRIPRDEDRFTNVGRLADGTQFMAYITGAFPVGYQVSLEDWQTVKRWQAVAHFFDADGRHLRTAARLSGVEADDPAGVKAFRHLNAIHDELAAGGEPEFGDIGVQLFSVEIDGIRYELRYEKNEYVEALKDEGEGYECVMFWPRDIMFHPPWDGGHYST